MNPTTPDICTTINHIQGGPHKVKPTTILLVTFECWTLVHTDLYFKTVTVTINCIQLFLNLYTEINRVKRILTRASLTSHVCLSSSDSAANIIIFVVVVVVASAIIRNSNVLAILTKKCTNSGWLHFLTQPFAERNLKTMRCLQIKYTSSIDLQAVLTKFGFMHLITLCWAPGTLATAQKIHCHVCSQIHLFRSNKA